MDKGTKKECYYFIFLGKIFSILIAFIFLGCTYNNTVAIQKTDNTNKKFDGLNEIFENNNTMIVFHIHGMGRHKSNEQGIIDFYDNVAKEMEFNEFLTQTYSLEKNKINYGNMTIKKYTSKTLSSTEVAREFILISLSWSDIMDGREDILHNASNIYKNRIASGNMMIKNLVNDGLGDAVLYLNPSYRSAVHTSIQIGIEKACELDSQLCNKPNVVVSSSLGSKMLFDVLDENLKMKNINYENFFSNIQQVFMTSNQIPLLDLYSATYDMNASTPFVKNKSATLTDMDKKINNFTLYKKKNKDKKLPIIAFSDPNDALSYNIYYESNNKIEFTNVTLTYARWWWFNLVANPLKAHQGFMEDEVGVKAFVYGSNKLVFRDY